jgi:hypothetical protein
MVGGWLSLEPKRSSRSLGCLGIAARDSRRTKNHRCYYISEESEWREQAAGRQDLNFDAIEHSVLSSVPGNLKKSVIRLLGSRTRNRYQNNAVAVRDIDPGGATLQRFGDVLRRGMWANEENVLVFVLR